MRKWHSVCHSWGVVSIRKRGKDRYQIRVYVGTGDDGDKFAYETFRGTLTEARQRERVLRVRHDRGRIIRSDRTVKDLLAVFMADRGANFAPGTRVTYQGYIDREIIPALGAIKVHQLTPGDLDAAYDRMLERLVPSTIRQIHAIIRGACKVGVKKEWMDRNPANDTSPPTVTRDEIVVPSVDDVRRLIDAADPGAPRLFLRLAAMTGARRGELCGLRFDDIADGTLTIRRSVTSVGGEVVEKTTKTRQNRRVDIGGAVELEVRGWRATLAEHALAHGRSLPDDAPLFPAKRGGGPINPDVAFGWFARARERAGVTFRLHDLRHFHATELLAAGLDANLVAARLGHANPSTTLNVYGHARPGDTRASETISRVMDR